MRVAPRTLWFTRARTFIQLICGMAAYMLTHVTVSEAADACWVARHSHGGGFLAGAPAYFLPDFYPNLATAKAAAIQDMEDRYSGLTPWCVSSPLTGFGLALPCSSCEYEPHGYSYLHAYGLNSIPPITSCEMGFVDMWDASRWGLPPESGLDISKCANYIIKLSTSDGRQESATIITPIEPTKVTKTLVAKVYDKNGQLVPTVNIKLVVNVAENSGGHRHHTNRPNGILRSGTKIGESLTGSTSNNGFSFTFQAPAPAGDFKITASCTSGKICKQEGPDTVWVGYKGLQPVGDNAVYRLIPNAAKDPGHLDNHYLTLTAASRLAVFASLYHAKYPDLAVLHLNDASLERGGIFDLKHNWRSPHWEHCRGTVIDIRANSAEGALNVASEADPMIKKISQLGNIADVTPNFEIPKDQQGNRIWEARHFHTYLVGQEGLQCP